MTRLTPSCTMPTSSGTTRASTETSLSGCHLSHAALTNSLRVILFVRTLSVARKNLCMLSTSSSSTVPTAPTPGSLSAADPWGHGISRNRMAICWSVPVPGRLNLLHRSSYAFQVRMIPSSSSRLRISARMASVRTLSLRPRASRRIPPDRTQSNSPCVASACSRSRRAVWADVPRSCRSDSEHP